jgi:hypothetical protein
MRDISEQWALDSEKISRSEIADRDRMQIEDHVQRIRTQAMMTKDIDEANAIADSLVGIIGESGVSKLRSDILKQASDSEKQRIEFDSFANPEETMDRINEQMRGGKEYYNLDPDDLVSAYNSARASYNTQISDNETAMWDRINAVKAGEGDGDSFKDINDGLENLRRAGKLTPSAYNSLKKVAENPYGTSKEPMSAIDLGAIWDEIGRYDPERDPRFDTAQGLWAKINAIPNEQDRTLLKGLMKDAQEGVPQSPYWSEMQELINADSRRNIFGDSEISPETGVFAKREVAKFLRANPTDRAGAEQLYKAISADDKKLNTRKFYRERYGYGSVVEPKGNVRVWGAK